MYASFAQTAREEGLDSIATLFSKVADIEKEHEARFLQVLENLEKKQVFSRLTEKTWVCRVCGHQHSGTEAPGACPVCGHPQAYFEVKEHFLQ